MGQHAALWTEHGARLQLQSTSAASKPFNWLFLPGGPGLGSESLSALTKLLKPVLNGAIWHLDLPGDGSNRVAGKPISGSRLALLQAVSSMENVVLVAHSSLGMFAQTVPELEDVLKGLALIGSAPDVSWQKSFGQYSNAHPDPAVDEAGKLYAAQATDETLRTLLLAAAGNSFITEATLKAGREMMRSLAVNHQASLHESDVFDSDHYWASWIPKRIPALIMNGEGDHITPFGLFENKPDYRRDNILLRKIWGAGHYPWFENPDSIAAAFREFLNMLV